MRLYLSLSLFGLLAVLAFNWWVDPAMFWYRAPTPFSKPIACDQLGILSSAASTNRDVKLSMLLDHPTPDVVVMGSSRGMTFAQEMFKPGTKFFNLAVSGGTIREYAALWEALKEHGRRPKYLFISLEPFSFNRGATMGDTWWRVTSGYLGRFRRELGVTLGLKERVRQTVRDLNTMKHNVISLAQWDTLGASVRYLYEHKALPDTAQRIVAKNAIPDDLPAYRCDGSLSPPRKFISTITLEGIRERARTVPNDPSVDYQYREYALDEDAVRLLARMADDAAAYGTEFLLMVTPMHPISLSKALGSPYHAAIHAEFKQTLRRLQTAAPKLRVCDVIDLKDTGCGEHEMEDGYHMLPSCDQKVLNRCFSRFGAWKTIARNAQ